MWARKGVTLRVPDGLPCFCQERNLPREKTGVGGRGTKSTTLRIASDERILGSSDFVTTVLGQAHEVRAVKAHRMANTLDLELSSLLGPDWTRLSSGVRISEGMSVAHEHCSVILLLGGWVLAEKRWLRVCR